MQGSARKDVVFGAAGVYPVTVPGPKWKSWLNHLPCASKPATTCSVTSETGNDSTVSPEDGYLLDSGDHKM